MKDGMRGVPIEGLTIEQAAVIVEQCLEDEEVEYRAFLQAIGCGDVMGMDIPGTSEVGGRLFNSGISPVYLKDWIAKAREGEAFPLLRVYDQFNNDIYTMAVAQQAAEQQYPLHAFLGDGCIERIRREANSRNGKKPRNKSPQWLHQAICVLAEEYPEEKGQRLSFDALLETFREDASCPSTETLMQELRNAGMVHIQIQEVDDQQERVYYRLTDGIEKTVKFRSLENLLSKNRKSFLRITT